MQLSPFPEHFSSRTRPAATCLSSHHSLCSLLRFDRARASPSGDKQQQVRFHFSREWKSSPSQVVLAVSAHLFGGMACSIEHRRCHSLDTLSSSGRYFPRELSPRNNGPHKF